MKLCRSSLHSFLLFISIFFSIFSTASAQSQFIKYYARAGNDCGYAVCKGVDGGTLVAGQTDSAGLGTQDLFLIKYSSTGNVEWSRTYGVPGFDIPLHIIPTPDSTYLMVGVSDNGLGNRDMIVMKFDADGGIVWSKFYGGLAEDQGASCRIHPDGGYIIIGSGASFSFGAWDGWAMRLADDGSVIWLRTYEGPQTEAFSNFAPTSDGGFIITGHTYSYGAGQHDAMLMKIDRDGTYRWTKTYGTYADETGYVVRETPDKGFLLTASSSYGFVGGQDCLTILTDSLGNLISAKAFGGPDADQMHRGYLVEPDGMLVAGYSGSDAWSALVGPDGLLQQSTRQDGGGVEHIYGTYREASGARILAGRTTAGPISGYNGLLIRTDASGTVAGGTTDGPSTPSTAILGVSSPTLLSFERSITAQPGPTKNDPITFETGFLVEVLKPLVSVMPAFGQASDSVSIVIKAANPAGIAGGDISVAIDTSILVPYGVRKGTLTQDFMFAYNISRPDSILVSFARAGGIEVDQVGSLFVVDCYVRADAGDSAFADIGLPFVALYDDQAQPVEADVAGGTFSTHLGVKGDVNQDALVNAADAILCLRLSMLMGPIVEDPRAQWAADFDGNGAVTTLDAVNILRTSVQLPPIVETGASQAVVKITIPLRPGILGEESNFWIRVAGLPTLVSGSLDLGFDPVSFRVESVEGQSDFQGVVTHGVTETNVVRIGFATATAWQKTDGRLADVHVTALRSVPSYLPSLHNVRMYDDAGNLVTMFEFVTTGVEDDELRPLEFSLSQNYPNPFNPATVIPFTVAAPSGVEGQDAHVRLTVHDLLGREVATLVDGTMSAGAHQVTFDASDLPSGIYFYTLTSGTSIERRKMTLVK